jgi:GT2 family glycosyltransferase
MKMATPFRFLSGGHNIKSLALAPARDVSTEDEGMVALSCEPWLRLIATESSLAEGWVTLFYESSLCDHLTRPVLRFFTPEGTREEILPAPVFGRATWIGRIPAQTTEIWLSPTNRPGGFAFRVTGLRRISAVRRYALGLSRRPVDALTSLGAALGGIRFLADLKSRRALGAIKLASYTHWRASGRRPPEWRGLDSMRLDAADGPHIRIFLPGANVVTLQKWHADLSAQPWTKWSLAGSAAAPSPAAAIGEAPWLDPEATLRNCIEDLDDRDVVAVLEANDILAPEALAALASAAMRDDADLFYSDEESAEIPPTPRFKPDWSPILAQGADIFGRAWFARVRWLRENLGDQPIANIGASPLRPTGNEAVCHIRRVLLSGSAHAPVPGALPSPAPPSPRAHGPCATLIIPTRDRLDLLQACVNSLVEKSQRKDFEAIVIDNGSVEPRTLAFFKEMQSDRRFRVLARPGPFNFSALCNDAAREARGDSLVFLNNDTEVLSADWLDRLLAWAALPQIGAVGAKLLYGDGGVQHAGVILGIDGRAAHFQQNITRDEAGYFGRACAPHEISAVTAACLAVSRTKFDAIGGFDEQNLPIEYNDLDFCLRLSERGWMNVLEPRALLFHHESASRGGSLSPDLRYSKEFAYFTKRWLHKLRDDPYFHPALSLDSLGPALG